MNEVRLIDANALKLDLDLQKGCSVVDMALAVVKSVQEAPTIDAVPVVHAKWEDAPYVYFGAKRYVCSNCCSDDFWNMRFVITKDNYCPNCGAKMDLKED